MSEARDAVFAALEAARPSGPDSRPAPMTGPPMPKAPLEVLAARLGQNGGVLVRASPDDWTREVAWPRPLGDIEHLFVSEAVSQRSPGSDAPPDPGLVSRGVGQITGDVHALSALEVCILEAEFCVVENGASWQIPRSPQERAAALLAEHLIVLVSASETVASLHDAYARIDLSTTDFGWFLSGPSKTADIEQAMVLGAHGPKTMQLVLLGSTPFSSSAPSTPSTPSA